MSTAGVDVPAVSSEFLSVCVLSVCSFTGFLIAPAFARICLSRYVAGVWVGRGVWAAERLGGRGLERGLVAAVQRRRGRPAPPPGIRMLEGRVAEVVLHPELERRMEEVAGGLVASVSSVVQCTLAYADQCVQCGPMRSNVDARWELLTGGELLTEVKLGCDILRLIGHRENGNTQRENGALSSVVCELVYD